MLDLAARAASVTGGHGGGGTPDTNPAGGGGGTHNTYQLPPAVATGQDMYAANAAQANQALNDFYAQYQYGASVGRNLFIPAYGSGIDNVPYDQIAKLHKGERVLTAEQNHYYPPANVGGRQSAGNSMTFNIDARGATMRPDEFKSIIQQEVKPLIVRGQVETLNIITENERKAMN